MLRFVKRERAYYYIKKEWKRVTHHVWLFSIPFINYEFTCRKYLKIIFIYPVVYTDVQILEASYNKSGYRVIGIHLR